jgi:hypothetical protein
MNARISASALSGDELPLALASSLCSISIKPRPVSHVPDVG